MNLNYSESINCTKANKELARKVQKRAKSKDASLGEEPLTWAVSNIMKAKK